MADSLLHKKYLDIAFEQLNKYALIEKEVYDKVLTLSEIREFPKKSVLVGVGEQEEYINMVISGLIRKYTFVRKKEITTQLSKEGHIINSELSFYRRQPSNFIIETIEPSMTISMTYENMLKMYENFPVSEKVFRLIISDMFIRKDNQYLHRLKKTTRERFLDFINSQPDMLQRVPQKYLASYLNIKPETFSRLKHLVKTNKQ